MISASNLSYRYPNGCNALSNISFTIKKGEFAALIGHNGSGKTTLLKHFNGLLKATSGSLIINGQDIGKTKTSSIAKYIGFLFQNPDHQIFCSTVYDEIAFGPRNMKFSPEAVDSAVKAAAEKVNITPLLGMNPFSLSKGHRQRVALASVLAMKNDVLVLDEPTTGQDYEEGLEIMNIIRSLNNEGKTVIIVTHDMELAAAYASRLIVLRNGRIISDGPAASVLANTETLAQSGLQAPQIFQLASRFSSSSLLSSAFTVQEMHEKIMRYARGELKCL